MKPLEEHLSTWKARQPSRRVAESLFGGPEPVGAHSHAQIGVWRGLIARTNEWSRMVIPATCGFAVVFMAVAPRVLPSTPSSWGSLNWNDQASVSYASAVFHTEKNAFTHTELALAAHVASRSQPQIYTTPITNDSVETNLTIH